MFFRFELLENEYTSFWFKTLFLYSKLLGLTLYIIAPSMDDHNINIILESFM